MQLEKKVVSLRFNRIIFEMDRHINFKKGFFAFYCLVGIYVAVMYLLSAFRLEDIHSYNVMMNLSLAFGLLSGIAFVEADKAKRSVILLLVGSLWIVGAVIEFVQSSKSGAWNKYYIVTDLYRFLFFFVPILVIWALSRIKKGRNVIQAFVGAVFSLFSLGFLPGRGKLEPLYDILLVVMPVLAFSIVAKNQRQGQRWLSLLVFLMVYSYVIVANPYGNLAMFVIVATALLMVLGIISAAWKDKTKKTALAVMTCLISAFAVFAIPSWGDYALNRIEYSESVRPVAKQVRFESGFVTPENDTISLESLQGKTVVLYFWDAFCGTCHAMMPDYSALAESCANAPDNVFYAVFLRKNNKESEKEMKHYEEMTGKEYAFRWVMALDAKEVMEKLEFNGVPHLTIISTDGTVAYNGIPDFSRTNVYNPRRYLNR